MSYIPKNLHAGSLVAINNNSIEPERIKLHFISNEFLRIFCKFEKIKIIEDKETYQQIIGKNWLVFKIFSNYNLNLFAKCLESINPLQSWFFNLFLPVEFDKTCLGIATGRTIPVQFNNQETCLVETLIMNKSLHMHWNFAEVIWFVCEDNIAIL